MVKIEKTTTEWQRILSKEQFDILRLKHTERAFSGKFWNHFEKGTYVCAGCDTPLFDSMTKFESSCGWPSFFATTTPDAIEERQDTSYGMIRTEIVCKNCGVHLGHCFQDGPPPTRLRYCINSAALIFKK